MSRKALLLLLLVVLVLAEQALSGYAQQRATAALI